MRSGSSLDDSFMVVQFGEFFFLLLRGRVTYVMFGNFPTAFSRVCHVTRERTERSAVEQQTQPSCRCPSTGSGVWCALDFLRTQKQPTAKKYKAQFYDRLTLAHQQQRRARTRTFRHIAQLLHPLLLYGRNHHQTTQKRNCSLSHSCFC